MVWRRMDFTHSGEHSYMCHYKPTRLAALTMAAPLAGASGDLSGSSKLAAARPAVKLWHAKDGAKLRECRTVQCPAIAFDQWEYSHCDRWRKIPQAKAAKYSSSACSSSAPPRPQTRMFGVSLKMCAAGWVISSTDDASTHLEVFVKIYILACLKVSHIYSQYDETPSDVRHVGQARRHHHSLL